MFSYLLAATLSMGALPSVVIAPGGWEDIVVSNYQKVLNVDFGDEFNDSTNVTHKDLNRDGYNEILISSLAHCGSLGCSYAVYSHDKKHVCHVGDVRDPIPLDIVGPIDCEHHLQPLG